MPKMTTMMKTWSWCRYLRKPRRNRGRRTSQREGLVFASRHGNLVALVMARRRNANRRDAKLPNQTGACMMKHRRDTTPCREAFSLAFLRGRGPCALLTIVMLSCMSGCGSVGKTIGVGLIATGGIATATAGILAFGCTTPNMDNPQIETRGPCMSPETYEEVKPVLWTTFVLGIIMAAAGVAVITTVDEKPHKAEPPPRQPPPVPHKEESCKESKYCY